MSDNISALEKLKNSYLNGVNSNYIEDLYEQYLLDANSVSEDWRNLFVKLPAELTNLLHSDVQAEVKSAATAPVSTVAVDNQALAIQAWVKGVREFGFKSAAVNPLKAPIVHDEIKPEFYNVKVDDKLYSRGITGLSKDYTGKQISSLLQQAYCGSIGAEFMYLSDTTKRSWISAKLESIVDYSLSQQETLQLYRQLVAANGMEQFLARKFVAQKRFSLEGGDALIPLFESMLEFGVQKFGLKEVAVAMAHRGRLNVMANVFGTTMDTICKRFTGELDSTIEISGDVKYHLGESVDREFPGGSLHLSLACNPSHLEFVNPVLVGLLKGKQELHYQDNPAEICGITVHGDAALCGQGIVPETLNLMRTNAHNTYGGIHIVINNQVGHSVSNIKDMTSCNQITDVFKAYDIPVIHVNADDPEAVVFCARLAMEYRFKFKQDIAIELLCYRRLGHNEADEPSVTQPLMYKFIKDHPRLCDLYKSKLLGSGYSTAQLDDINLEVENIFKQGLSLVPNTPNPVTEARSKMWNQYCHFNWDEDVNTGYQLSELQDLSQQLQTLPAGFSCQKQIARLMQQRADMVAGKVGLNWGMAELLAYASLVKEGFLVRLVGQDVRRGTFSHRQAVMHDYVTGLEHNLFANIKGENGAGFSVFDSTLSEAAVLGAEYGYSLANPKALVLWEAQFGDFANSAQVIIDQFISSAWQKWQQLANVVLLLPHGYEGQGPEHSSARLERYLQLSAQHSMQVCVPTTPSQIFHLLRRQMHRKFRQPLIIMSPKSLLRHPEAISTYEDLSQGDFLTVIDDIQVTNKQVNPKDIKRVVICSGKIYYELLAQNESADIALIRLEQLYPFPYQMFKGIMSKYTNADKVIWCQEEPKNQGAWFARRHCFEKLLLPGQSLHYVGRDMYASTAAGSPKLHKKRQQLVIGQALGLMDISPVKYD